MKRLLIEVFTAMSLIAAIGACGGETRGRSAVSSESSAADDVAGGSPVFAPANIDEPPPPTVTYAGQATTTTTPRHAPSVTSPAAPPSSTSTSTLPMDTTTTVTTSTTVAPVTTAVDECASITLQADALFRSESAVIDPTAETALLARIAPLIECMQPGDRLRLDAWTDDRGGALDNLELSEARAASTVVVIAKEWPQLVDETRSYAHGESDPPSPCTGDCPQNRVVVISIVRAGG